MLTAAADRPVDENAERWPAVRLAYDFVLPWTKFMVSRFEAADTRLTTLLTLTSSLTLSAPVVARAVRPAISFSSPWFLAAMAVFIASALLGVVGRVYGRVVLVDPGLLYQKSLHETPWAFQKNALFFAGQHFVANRAAIARKSQISIALSVLLPLEILLFVIWIAR